MAVKWIPSNITGRVDETGTYIPSGMGPILVWDDIDTYDTSAYTEPQIVALDSFRIIAPNRTWKTFRSCKKIAKQQ